MAGEGGGREEGWEQGGEMGRYGEMEEKGKGEKGREGGREK